MAPLDFGISDVSLEFEASLDPPRVNLKHDRVNVDIQETIRNHAADPKKKK